jgi:thiamine pyrophosphate-dependent acetolactate synthase large subunit-like protein
MNLGSLATIAGVKPKNLVHFVMHNGMYSVTGGQPIPAKEVISFTSMAEGAGYAATYEFDDLEDFTVQLDEIMKLQGPVFVTIKAVPEVQNEPIAQRVRSPRARTTTEAMALMHAELTA